MISSRFRSGNGQPRPTYFLPLVCAGPATTNNLGFVSKAVEKNLVNLQTENSLKIGHYIVYIRYA